MKKFLVVLSLLLALTAAAAGGFLVGLDRGKQSTQTFYATIDSVNGNHMQVTGLPVNDINFRWRFDFSISEDTKLDWRYTELELSNFKEGQTVAITFDGSVQETDPAGITHVNRITLLDDTKE